MYVCMSVGLCMSVVSAEARRGNQFCLELQFQGIVSYLLWVPGTELHSVRAVGTFHCWAISPSSNSRLLNEATTARSHGSQGRSSWGWPTELRNPPLSWQRQWFYRSWMPPCQSEHSLRGYLLNFKCTHFVLFKYIHVMRKIMPLSQIEYEHHLP